MQCSRFYSQGINALLVSRHLRTRPMPVSALPPITYRSHVGSLLPHGLVFNTYYNRPVSAEQAQTRTQHGIRTDEPLRCTPYRGFLREPGDWNHSRPSCTGAGWRVKWCGSDSRSSKPSWQDATTAMPRPKAVRMVEDRFLPDLIVAIPRGGLVIAGILAKQLGDEKIVPVISLSRLDGPAGFNNPFNHFSFRRQDFQANPVKILIVDDILSIRAHARRSEDFHRRFHRSPRLCDQNRRHFLLPFLQSGN